MSIITVELIGKRSKRTAINAPNTYEELIKALKKKLTLPNDLPLNSLKFENEEHQEIEVTNDDQYQDQVIDQDGVKITIQFGEADRSKDNSSSFSKDNINKSQAREDDNDDPVSNYLNEKIGELTEGLNQIDSKHEMQDQQLSNITTMIQSIQSSEAKAKGKGSQGPIVKIKTLRSSKLVHEGVKCSNCSECPLKGRLYQCSQCLNLNYCSKCRGAIVHNHNFIVFTRLKNNISAKPTKSKIDFVFPDENLSEENVYEIEMTNNGDIPWPSDISLKCIEEQSDISFIALPLQRKIIQPNQRVICKIEFEELSSFEDGSFSIKAQLRSNQKSIGPVIEITLRLQRQGEEDADEDADKDADEDFHNPKTQMIGKMKNPDTILSKQKFNTGNQQENNMNNNNNMRQQNNPGMNNYNNYGVKPQDVPQQGKGGYGPPMNTTNKNNPKPNANYFNSNQEELMNQNQNQNQNQFYQGKQNDKKQKNPVPSEAGDSDFCLFGNDVNPDTQINPSKTKSVQSQGNPSNSVTQNKGFESIIEEPEDSSEFMTFRQDDAPSKSNKKEQEDSSEFKTFIKDDNPSEKEKQKPIMHNPDVNQEKLQRIMKVLNPYNFEPIISKSTIEETIIKNNYDEEKSIDNLWVIYDANEKKMNR